MPQIRADRLGAMWWELLPEVNRQAALRVLSMLADRVVTATAGGTVDRTGRDPGGEGDAGAGRG
ncbi:hypothetical protein [Frankia sp. EAN1pec]|uniref:hypothetical protein n=1 Tax=Parafrankia sp. (strain EAN1pec) TaxID=298653 RepID=UPI00059E0FF5